MQQTLVAPAQSTRRPGLWMLASTHAVNDFYTGAVAALLPYLVLERHYDYAAVAGITLAATSLSSVAQPVFGYLSDRFALRWLVIVGMLVAAAGVAVSGVVSASYWTTWLVVAVSGIGVAAFHPAATMAARDAGGGTNRSMSFFSVGGNVGVTLAPAAVGLTVGILGVGATPLLAIPAAAVAVVYLVRTRRSRTPLSLAGASRPGAAGAASRAPALPNNWRLFALLLFVLAFWSVAYVGTSSFVSLYSIQRFGVSEGTASIALSVFPAAGAVGTILGGWLADRFGRLRTIRAGYAFAAAALLLIALAPSVLLVVIATALLGCALFIPFAPQITLSHSYLPKLVGTASGLTLGLTLSLGGFLSPALGALADSSTVQAVFLLLAGLVAAGFALSFVLRERRDGKAGQESASPSSTVMDGTK